VEKAINLVGLIGSLEQIARIANATDLYACANSPTTDSMKHTEESCTTSDHSLKVPLSAGLMGR
jgi:hypothetical protein